MLCVTQQELNGKIVLMKTPYTRVIEYEKMKWTNLEPLFLVTGFDSPEK